MKRSEIKLLDKSLENYFQELIDGLGRTRSEARQAIADYMTGLLLDGHRKSIQPMAARLVSDEAETEAMRQRLQQCVVHGKWNDDEFRARLQNIVVKRFEGPEALVIDDTGFAKKGKHSPGVQRQYSGTLGRVDNCQIAVSTHIAKRDSSCCLEMDLYLPEEWSADDKRKKKAGIPAEIEFRKKNEIALAQLDKLIQRDVPNVPVLADAGYGDGKDFRNAITERGFNYVVSLTGKHLFWTPESNPQIPPRTNTMGRPKSRYKDEDNPPMQAQNYALSLGRKALRKVRWDVSSSGPKSSFFGFARVRSAHNHTKGNPPGNEEWLFWEWPNNKSEPTKYWLSTMPPATPLKRLVYLAKLRWRIERDYQEMKQEIGLTHYEGRTWNGFHHHLSLCMAAHAFLVLFRTIFPPQHNTI